MPRLPDTTWTCPGCISGCPSPYSAGGKGVNGTDRDACILAAGTRRTDARDACIVSTCAVGTWIGCASDGGACTSGICAKSASVRGVEPGVGPRALLGSGITFAGLWVNDCCRLLLIGLRFSSTEGLICQDG